MLTPEQIERLKAFFPVADHKERKLPGGGKWFFIPWQQIRERVAEVDPNFGVTYSHYWITPEGSYTIKCSLTIAGITREAMGFAPAPEYNASGNRKGIGSPEENAIADAFKNAAENFGVGAYLDDQKATIKYMSSQSDSRAFRYAKENEEIEAGARGKKVAPTLPTPKEGCTTKELLPELRSRTNSADKSDLIRAIYKGADCLEIPMSALLDDIEQRYNNRLLPGLEVAQLQEILEKLRSQYANSRVK